LVTDENGNEVYSAAHGPYGETLQKWPGAFDPKMKFSGKERESHSELDYFGARYYDHNRYRFSSVDPIINKEEALSNPQLWNLYAYCGNNPITNYDPDGRQFTGVYPPNIIKKTVVLEHMIDTGQSYQDMYLHALEMEEKALNLLSMVINTAGGLAKSIFKSGWKGAMQEMGKLAAKKGAKIFTKEMLSRAKKFAWGGGEGKYKFRDASKYAKKYGGKVKDWKKMKSLDANGNEWHWVEHKGKKYDLKPK
jgi:RHS repeat-associated protein